MEEKEELKTQLVKSESQKRSEGMKNKMGKKAAIQDKKKKIHNEGRSKRGEKREGKGRIRGDNYYREKF